MTERERKKKEKKNFKIKSIKIKYIYIKQSVCIFIKLIFWKEFKLITFDPEYAASLGYQRGLTDINSTLAAEQSWRATRAQLTSAQVQSLRRSVQAFKAIGGGWPAQAYADR